AEQVTQPQQKASTSRSRAFATNTVQWKPPNRGSPRVRVDGGTRGGNTDLPSLYVLAPEEVGYTTKPQPSLFWYQSKSTNAVVFTLETQTAPQKPRLPKPSLEVRLPPVMVSGIQRFNLAQHNITLADAVEYRW